MMEYGDIISSGRLGFECVKGAVFFKREFHISVTYKKYIIIILLQSTDGKLIILGHFFLSFFF
jgi:hypothetical protein